jgi:hypothetical protein
MAGKTAAWALAGILLIGCACQAQEFGADCGPGCGADCGHGCSHGHGHGLHRRNDDGRTCCQRIWGWWTYRPLPVPHHLKGCIRFQQTPQAPFYAYFVYLYGPRSPALGFKPTPVHRGESCAHGMAPAMYSDAIDVPLDGVPAAPEEGLPAPRLYNAIPPPPYPGTLPKQPVSEPEQTSQDSSATTVPVLETTENREP